MAVVNTKSTAIQNAENPLQVLNPLYKDGGTLHSKVETVEVANGDSAASVFRFFRVHSGWRVDELYLDSDDIGTTSTIDIGLYDTTANGAAVVDADFFASAVVTNAGAVAHSHVTRESGVIDIANKHKRIWEQLGLTADPNKYYDLCATLVGAADGAGTITLSLKYVDNN
jgi:hypothetical protein